MITIPLPLNELKQGMYWSMNGDMVRVQKSRQSSNLYGKILNPVTNKFEYKQGLIYNLKEKMTLAQAIHYGKVTGNCCVCGRLLTNKKSIDLAIGPICRGYF